MFAGEIPKEMATSCTDWMYPSVVILMVMSSSGLMVEGTAKPLMRALARDSNEAAVAKTTVVRILTACNSVRIESAFIKGLYKVR